MPSVVESLHSPPSLEMPSESPHSVLLQALHCPPIPPTPLSPAVLTTLLTALSNPLHSISSLVKALCNLPISAIPPPHAITLTKALLCHTRNLLEEDICNITNFITLHASRSPATAQQVHKLNPCGVISLHPQSPRLRACLSRLLAMTTPPKARKRPIRILSLDGGGTRAVLTLELLTLLSTRLGPLDRCFDYIIGTSSGGVIALALGLLHLSPREVQRRYKQLSAKLFRKRARGLIGRGLYDGDIVTNFAREVCGERRICFADGGVMVGVVSATPGGVLPYIHTNYRSCGRYTWSGCHKLVDIVRATTAAPLLFEVYESETGERFVDGGVVCNNPTAVGVHECMTLFPGVEVGCVVSVGSGRMEMFGGGLVKALLWRMTDTEILHHVLEDVLKGYYRLNCDIRRTGLDVSGGVLEELIVIARRWGEGEGRALLDELCSYLEKLRNHHNPLPLSRL